MPPKVTKHFSTQPSTQAKACGSVLLLGAGPGDPGLLTVRALEALKNADVVLYDTLVAQPILDLINPACELIHVGKKGYGHTHPQQEINDQIIQLAQQGRQVIRLKSGDPLIFGRAGDEIAACQAAGVSLEIVPGITAAQGAAASLAVSLTHRHVARRLQYITGHDASGKLPTSIDWRVVADPQATTIIYMPRATIEALVSQASAAGLKAETPAVIMLNATRVNEVKYKTTIAGIVDTIAEINAINANDPMLVMIGAAMDEATLQEALSSQAELNKQLA